MRNKQLTVSVDHVQHGGSVVLEQCEKVLAGGRPAGRIPVRRYDVNGTVTTVFPFQQRADHRSVRGRRPGIDVRRAATKVVAGADTALLMLLLLMVVVGLMVVVVVVMVVRVVREFQAGVASVQRILDGPLLLSAGRRQAGVGAGPQHVAVVIVHRLGRMLTRRASGGSAAVTRASF